MKLIPYEPIVANSYRLLSAARLQGINFEGIPYLTSTGVVFNHPYATVRSCVCCYDEKRVVQNNILR